MSSSQQRNHTRRNDCRRPDATFPSLSVPTAQQVMPSVSVSIVLKKDQATGHEVQGCVSRVLTRGNHPRGIKVRLIDGRVGRVQRLVCASEVDERVEMSPQPIIGTGSSAHPYADIRFDANAHVDPERHEASLEDFVVVKRKGRTKAMAKDSQATSAHDNHAEDGTVRQKSTMVLCPVCEDFQGDEAAVSHHVNSHFS
ncbi:hypothetical protein K3495_g10318 [Podosphaera aphanis]|nr:hypothetical protein K3495_g10318 [Podosphaera aphanis]